MGCRAVGSRQVDIHVSVRRSQFISDTAKRHIDRGEATEMEARWQSANMSSRVVVNGPFARLQKMDLCKERLFGAAVILEIKQK